MEFYVRCFYVRYCLVRSVGVWGDVWGWALLSRGIQESGRVIRRTIGEEGGKWFGYFWESGSSGGCRKTSGKHLGYANSMEEPCSETKYCLIAKETNIGYERRRVKKIVKEAQQRSA